MDNTKDSSQYVSLNLEEGTYKTLPTRKYQKRKSYEPHNPKVLTAFIPGTIRKVNVKKGKKVKKHEVLVVLEAMKMNNQIFAPFDGTIKELPVKEGELVTKDQVLVVMK